MRMRIRRTPATIAAVVLACGAVAATALAFSSGGAQVQMINQESAALTATTAAPWVFLPGAAVNVNVPANSSRLINARFTAESQCTGPAAGWCTLRIVANGMELRPVAGIDYAFDTDVVGATNDQWEGNAMERSGRLFGGPEGTNYAIAVQRGVTNAGSTVFDLDDWHLAVEVSL